MALTPNESVLDSIEEDILIIDRNLNILNANSHLLNSLNLEEKDVIGESCYKVTRCDPPDENCPLLEVLKTGKSSTKICTYLDKNGSKIYMEVAIYPLGEGKNTDKFIHIGRDVTERVEVEREIKDYIGMLNKKIGGATSEPQKKRRRNKDTGRPHQVKETVKAGIQRTEGD